MTMNVLNCSTSAVNPTNKVIKANAGNTADQKRMTSLQIATIDTTAQTWTTSNS